MPTPPKYRTPPTCRSLRALGLSRSNAQKYAAGRVPALGWSIVLTVLLEAHGPGPITVESLTATADRLEERRQETRESE